MFHGFQFAYSILVFATWISGIDNKNSIQGQPWCHQRQWPMIQQRGQRGHAAHIQSIFSRFALTGESLA